jgi:hypothetical protein
MLVRFADCVADTRTLDAFGGETSGLQVVEGTTKFAVAKVWVRSVCYEGVFVHGVAVSASEIQTGGSRLARCRHFYFIASRCNIYKLFLGGSLGRRGQTARRRRICSCLHHEARLDTVSVEDAKGSFILARLELLRIFVCLVGLSGLGLLEVYIAEVGLFVQIRIVREIQVVLLVLVAALGLPCVGLCIALGLLCVHLTCSVEAGVALMVGLEVMELGSTLAVVGF